MEKSARGPDVETKEPELAPQRPAPPPIDPRAYLQLPPYPPPAQQKRCGSCPFLNGNEAEIPCKIALAILAFGSTFLIAVLSFLLLRAYSCR